MINKIREYFNEQEYIKELTIVDNSLFYEEQSNKLLYYDKESEVFYLFIEKQEGLYRYVSKGIFEIEFFEIDFTKLKKRKGEYVFYFRAVKKENEEVKYYKENFLKIMHQTKEMRLKMVFNKNKKRI